MAEPQERPRESLPPHVTTPLLTLITQQALEGDYRAVAERRQRGGAPVEPPRARLVAASAIAVFGVLISVSAVQNSRNEAVDSAGRATLISKIGEERNNLEDLQASIADRSRDNRRLLDAVTALTADRQQTVAQLRRLQLATGYFPATGEGVRIIVNGNPVGDEKQQVRDSDLAILADGLWEAGAEAIAINDQRLNPLGAIRNVGTAIHVNTVPLSPPYVVRAIGNQDTLQANLLNTTHGAEFFSLADQLGFDYTVDDVDELDLPAARQRRLSHVRTETDKGVEEGPS